jgi:hypothetical protein
MHNALKKVLMQMIDAAAIRLQSAALYDLLSYGAFLIRSHVLSWGLHRFSRSGCA